MTQLHIGNHPRRDNAIWHMTVDGTYWCGYQFQSLTPEELHHVCLSTLSDLITNHPELKTPDLASELLDAQIQVNAMLHQRLAETNRILDARYEALASLIDAINEGDPQTIADAVLEAEKSL